MTTMAFLVNGIQEANPLVRYAIDSAHHPLGGLLIVKTLAIGLGFYCWRGGRQRLLSKVNVLFAVLVAWNILALILGSIKIS